MNSPTLQVTVNVFLENLTGGILPLGMCLCKVPSLHKMKTTAPFGTVTSKRPTIFQCLRSALSPKQVDYSPVLTGISQAAFNAMLMPVMSNRKCLGCQFCQFNERKCQKLNLLEDDIC